MERSCYLFFAELLPFFPLRFNSSFWAHQPGPATSIEVTGQSGKPRYTPSVKTNIVREDLRPPNRTTPTQPDSEAREVEAELGLG